MYVKKIKKMKFTMSLIPILGLAIGYQKNHLAILLPFLLIELKFHER